MIASLRGVVYAKLADRAVVDVNGVGYEVFLSTDGVARVGGEGEETFLHIHTNVREDAITLFGFLEVEEKEVFLILRTVSGIGPKVALGILSGMRVPDLCEAIGSEDIKRLTTLPGVGKKTAERICVELKEKVSGFSVSITGETASVGSAAVKADGSIFVDALSALTNLGYSDPIAREALAQVKAKFDQGDLGEISIEILIREGLKVLA